MKNKEFYSEYMQIFLKQNACMNLISKNDEKFLWEKHVFDSLAIEKFFEIHYPHPLKAGEHLCEATRTTNARTGLTLLDIGTGGGFPAIPIALTYSEIEVTALDSIRKKINALENIKSELDIRNLIPLCGRAENLTEQYDVITSRAVASLDKISSYALPLMKNDGYFIAYKSRKTPGEIASAKKNLKKYGAEIIDIIEYKLPLEENFTRNLIIIKN